MVAGAGGHRTELDRRAHRLPAVNENGAEKLIQNASQHSTVHVGQPMVTALVFEGQFGVVDSQAVQHGRMQIEYMDRIFGNVVAIVVGFSVRDSRLDTPTSHPDREAAWMVISAIVIPRQVALAVDGAAKLTTPDDQGVVEQPPGLEIRDKRGRCLVGVSALGDNRFRQILVMIPAAVEELNEPDTAFGKPSGQQTIGGERAPRACVRAVQIKYVFRLIGHVSQVRQRHLHAISQFVLRDPSNDFGITYFRYFQLIEPGQVVEHPAADVRAQPIRVRQKKHRVGNGSKLRPLVLRRKEAAAPKPVVQRLSAESAALRHHGHKGGQILVLTAQPVRQPGPDAWPACPLSTRLEERDRRIMVDGFGVHRLEEAQLVGDLRRERHQLTDPRPAFSAPGKLKLTRCDREPCLFRRHPGQPLALAHRIGQLSTPQIVKLWFVVKQVHL